jgi:hypothetical protein
VFTVTGSPLLPWVDALTAVLVADAALALLAPGGIVAALPRSVRVVEPYVIVGRREIDTLGGAMQISGGLAHVTLDTWSAQNGPAETQQIQARCRVLLERQALRIPGFAMLDGSLTCEVEDVTADFDPDMPELTLFHGVQTWMAWLEEAA